MTYINRRRNLLAIHKLEKFADWACRNGYQQEPTKSLYEVLRLKSIEHGDGPLLFYKKKGAKVHVTSFGEGNKLIRRWIRERVK